MPHSIRYLVDHPEHLKTVINWYWKEWDQHEGWNIEQTREFVNKGLNKDKLDIILIATNDNNECVGTIQLRSDWGLTSDTPEALNQYSPWLGSLFVEPKSRGGQLGFKLCNALKTTIKNIGINQCYAATSHLDRFFSNQNGVVIGETNFANKNMRIYKFSLGN